MENNRLYVDIHILQTLPPSCVNRDDTGSPKTAVYGGVMRARVSSQSWKYAIRKAFKDSYPPEKLGIRTRKLVKLFSEEIQKREGVDEAETIAKKRLISAGLISKDKQDDLNPIRFLTCQQIEKLAEISEKDLKKPQKGLSKAVKEALALSPTIDIALFGRMLAEDSLVNIDACAQVAHSISTHKVSTEYDYFTAVDDLAGTAHIGTVEYNSSTLYRYATVAVHELHRQLGDDTIDAVRAFVRSFVCSMPTGKQNTFANRTLPDAVLVVLRKDQPINLVGAFEKPVPISEDGFVAASAKRLVNQATSVYRDFAGEPERSLVSGAYLSELGSPQPFGELLNTLAEELNRLLVNEEVAQ